MSDAVLFALIGIGVFLLLIPLSIRMVKSALGMRETEEPEPVERPAT